MHSPDVPAHVTSDGRLFLGGDELPYLIAADSIKAEQIRRGRNHLLTLTLIVGPVTLDQRTPKSQDS